MRKSFEILRNPNTIPTKAKENPIENPSRILEKRKKILGSPGQRASPASSPARLVARPPLQLGPPARASAASAGAPGWLWLGFGWALGWRWLEFVRISIGFGAGLDCISSFHLDSRMHEEFYSL